MRQVVIFTILTMISATVRAAVWEVPITEQEPGGFDHVQIRLAPGFKFASPSFYPNSFAAFTPQNTLDPRGFSWSQLFLNNLRNFTVATGPDLQDSMLAYTLLLDGDPTVDRPSFHYQSYLGQTRVANYDFYNVGNTGVFADDWLVLGGTWAMNQPIPPFIPGDANRDAAVDVFDIIDHWQLNYTGPGGTGMTWEQGDWNGDGSVDIFDVIDHWQLNYTGPISGPPPLSTRIGEIARGGTVVVPEPATTAWLLASLGTLALLRRGRRDRR